MAKKTQTVSKRFLRCVAFHAKKLYFLSDFFSFLEKNFIVLCGNFTTTGFHKKKLVSYWMHTKNSLSQWEDGRIVKYSN